MFKDYDQYDATGLAALVASRDVTPSELLAAAWAKIEAAEPKLNAISQKFHTRAQAQIAQGPTGPFAGVPFLLKDLDMDYAGQTLTMGSRAAQNYVAPHNAELVNRYLAAGLIIAGSTNAPELGLKATTETALHGATRNPWNPERTPGGSSGGAGAAVAAGFCEAAMGTDTLGSARIPAAYCGVTGHKPPHGAISTDGVVPLAPRFDTVGIVARTPAIAGTVRDWLDSSTQAISVARLSKPLGLFPLDGTTVSAAVRDAVARMAEKAARQGLSVETLPPSDFRLHDVAKAAFLTVALSAAETYDAERKRAPEGFSPALHNTMAWARAQPSARRHAAQDLLSRAAEAITQAFAPYAAVLMPTTPQPAFAFGATRPKDTADFTSLANVTGLAATCFPAGVQEGGLALSVQAVGADEQACLAVARLLSE
jgi:aspartyl-tRNA(Asn)/glutamyl-tRNA(Gln) amidotransferase subunit A